MYNVHCTMYNYKVCIVFLVPLHKVDIVLASSQVVQIGTPPPSRGAHSLSGEGVGGPSSHEGTDRFSKQDFVFFLPIQVIFIAALESFVLYSITLQQKGYVTKRVQIRIHERKVS